MDDKKLTTIYIVRHGESEENINVEKRNVFQPHFRDLESPLTKLGTLQAKKRAESLNNIKFDAIFSSDLARASQTAQIIALEKKLAVQTTKALREIWHYRFNKLLETKSKEQIQEEMREELQKLDEKGKMQYKYDQTLESTEEAATRLLTFIREVAVAYPGKTILIVNHAVNMRALLTHLGFAKYDELPRNSIEKTGYFVLETDGVDFSIKETQGINKQPGAMRLY